MITVNLNDVVSAIRVSQKASALVTLHGYARVSEDMTDVSVERSGGGLHDRADHLYGVHMRSSPSERGERFLSSSTANNQILGRAVPLKPVRKSDVLSAVIPALPINKFEIVFARSLEVTVERLKCRALRAPIVNDSFPIGGVRAKNVDFGDRIPARKLDALTACPKLDASLG